MIIAVPVSDGSLFPWNTLLSSGFGVPPLVVLEYTLLQPATLPCLWGTLFSDIFRSFCRAYVVPARSMEILSFSEQSPPRARLYGLGAVMWGPPRLGKNVDRASRST